MYMYISKQRSNRKMPTIGRKYRKQDGHGKNRTHMYVHIPISVTSIDTDLYEDDLSRGPAKNRARQPMCMDFRCITTSTGSCILPVSRAGRQICTVERRPLYYLRLPGGQDRRTRGSWLIETNEVLNWSSSSLTPQIGAGA